MSANTIKVVGSTGEVFILPQTTQTYKSISLFGYGYLDWGRVVNQSLVSLIDKIELISTNGLSQIEFDLETYNEEQKIARTQEFETWKTEYKNILTTMLNDYMVNVNQSIEEFSNAQTLINTAVDEELQSLDSKIDENYNQFMSTVDEKILEIVNTNMRTIADKVNNTISSAEQAINVLNQTKLSMDQKIVEFNNLIANFKSTFTDAFENFKLDTANTLEDNKNNILQYVNEKLLGYGTSLNAQSDRLDALELLLEGVDSNYITNLIISKVDEVTGSAVNAYLSNMVNRIQTLENQWTNLNATVTNIVRNLVDSTFEEIDSKIEAMDNKFITYDSKISDFNNALADIRTWTRDFDNVISIYYSDKQEFLAEVKVIQEDFMIAAGKRNSVVNIIKDTNEAIIKQTDENIRDVLNSMDLQQQYLMSSLRNTNFDENSLIRNDTYRKNLLTNKVKSLEFNNIFGNDEFKLVEFGYMANADDIIKFIYLSLKVPDSNFSNNFDYCDVRVSIGNKIVPDAGTPYFNGLLFKMDRQFLAIENLADVIPNYSNIIDDNIKGTISDAIYYSDIKTSDNMIISIPEGFIVEPTDIITITVGSDSISFKIEELNDTGSLNFVSNILQNIINYTPTTQAIINNHIIPYLTYGISKNDINIPLKEIVNLQSSKEFHIKVNLPTNSTITNIVINDGVSNSTKTITNRAKFNQDLTTYNSTGWNTTSNYYQDICTTGVLKFPINNTSTKVSGTVNYKIGSTSYSKDFSSSETIDYGNYNIVFDNTNDILEITYKDVNKYTFDKDGNFTASGDILAYSDETLKENILKLDSEIFQKVLLLQSYQYNFKDKDKLEFGYLAQEVEKIFPNLVSKDSNDTYRINYIAFIPLISEYIKQIDTKQKELEKRLDRLEVRM